MSGEADVRRVLMVAACPFPSPQGSQVYVAGMAQGLAERGCAVRLATFGFGAEGGRPAPPGVVRVPVDAPARGRSLRSGPGWGRLLHDAALVRGVTAAWRADPPDAVVAHHVEGLVGALAARRALGARAVPVVFVLHTALGEELPTYLPWASAPASGLRAGIGAGVAGIGAVADRVLARWPDAAVAPSARGAGLLASWGASEVAAVLPGIDPDELTRVDPGAVRAAWGLGARPQVVYTGNTDAYQDLERWLDAMTAIPEADLLIVTHAPAPALEAALAARGLKARSRVRVEAGLDAVAAALSVAAAAVVPRAVLAGFPVKVLNPLLLGVPVVAVADAVAGLPGVVRAHDPSPEALGAALRALLADPERAAEIGAEGRAEVMRSWSHAARAADLLAVLDRVITRRASAP